MDSDNKLLDPELKRKLELLRDTPPRDSDSASLGKRSFLLAAASAEKSKSDHTRKQQNKWIPFLSLKQKRPVFISAVTILLILTVIFAGSAATVYAAQDSNPNDTLYPVKIWSEDFRLDMTRIPETEFTLLTSYVLRRFAEMDSIIADEESIPPGLVTRLENHLGDMLQLASQMEDEDMEKALIRVRSLLQEREQLMTNQGENVPEWANPVYAQIKQMLTERLRRIENGIEDPLKFKQQMDSPAGGHGPGPGTGSDNPEEIEPIPPGHEEEKPADPGLCDPTQEGCGARIEPETTVPADPPMNGATQGPQGPGDSQKDQNNPGNGSGGKP